MRGGARCRSRQRELHLDGPTVAVRVGEGDTTRRMSVTVVASANGIAAVRSADDDRPLAEGDEVARS